MNEKIYEYIENILDVYVRPTLASHKGAIEVVELDEDGTLWVEMLGQCAGCPSSDETLKNLVYKTISERVPQVKEVQIDTGITDEIMEQAMSLMTKRNQK